MLSWHGRNRRPKNLYERKVNFQRAEESINLWRQVGIEKYLAVVLFMSLKILRNAPCLKGNPKRPRLFGCLK